MAETDALNTPAPPDAKIPPADRRRRILRDFEAWLEELDERELDDLTEDPDGDAAPGIGDLFGELTALRRDMQIQGKNSAALRNDVAALAEQVGPELAGLAGRLTDAADRVRGGIPDARREAKTEAALELAALVEGVERCRDGVGREPLPRWLWREADRAGLREQLRRPLDLLAKRGADALRRLGLRPTAAAGDRFDPATMRAAEAVSVPGTPAGTVVEVLGQGYAMDGTVIRVAEVKVNG